VEVYAALYDLYFKKAPITPPELTENISLREHLIWKYEDPLPLRNYDWVTLQLGMLTRHVKAIPLRPAVVDKQSLDRAMRI